MTERPANSFKLCTVDVWDTVLRRRCHPDAVKLETARKLLLRYGSHLSPIYRDSWALLELRCRIEGELARAARAAPGSDDEYMLSDVLNELISRASASGALDSSTVAVELEKEELAHECYVSYVDPGIRDELATVAGEKTVFLSDFYMSANALSSLLQAKGAAGLFDGGHCSCDHKLNKRSGRLFELTHQLYGVAPHEHFHIGDNPAADCESPRRLAIQARHYAPPEEERLREQKRRVFYDRKALFKLIGEECRAKFSSQSDPAAAAAQEYGLALSPMFAGFALFILESVQRDRADKLFFFTREGEFFIRLYEALRVECPAIAQAAPPGTVLEVSRMATFCASLREFSIEEMMRLWSLYSTQSMSAWAQSLGLPPTFAAAWCAEHGIPFEQPIRYPWQDPRVRGLFDDRRVKEAMESLIAQNRTLLLRFLESKGLRDSTGNVAIVDIGWRGSIQDNISILMPGNRFHGYYLGLQKFLNAQPGNSVKSAFGPDLNESPEHARLFGNLPRMEMLTNSPHGSVVGYQRFGDTVNGIRQIDEGENAVQREVAAHFQDGVVQAVRIWGQYLHTHAVSSVELRDHALKLWAQLVEKPPPLIARAQMMLRHNESFGLGKYVEKKSHWPLFLTSLFRSAK